MLVFLIVAGVVITMSGLNGQVAALETQIKKDLLGSANEVGFLEWTGAILLVAGITKSLDIPDAGRVLMILILIVFVLQNESIIGGFATQLEAIAPASGGATSGASASSPSAPH